MKRGIICATLALAVSVSALGAEKKSITLPEDSSMSTLKPGPGVEVVRANCVACHSTDYIVRQRPADAKQWEPEVKKMITVFGAPISESDAKVIADYLMSAYGPQPKEEPAAAVSEGKASSKKQGTQKASNH